MKTHELLREGEWTTDGRLLAPDSIRWGMRIPLVVRSFGDTGHIVGAVTNIRREGNRILGDTDVTIGDHMTLTCDLDVDAVVQHTDRGMEVSAGRLMAAHVNDKHKYPWKNREEGGDANAR